MNTDGHGPKTAERLNCLVTGASGYIGGRLVPELLGEGHAVRWLARSPGKLRVFGGMARNITQAAAEGMCAHANDSRTGRRRGATARSRTRPQRRAQRKW